MKYWTIGAQSGRAQLFGKSCVMENYSRRSGLLKKIKTLALSENGLKWKCLWSINI